MNRLLGTALMLLLVVVSGAPTAAPTDRAIPLGSVPILSLREVESPCGGPGIQATVTTPEICPGFVIQRSLRRSSLHGVRLRSRITQERRLVYRTVTHQVPCTRQVFVAVTTRVQKLCMVYKQREELRPRTVLVAVKRREMRVRPVYRPVSRQVPCTRDVYVRSETREKKVRLVYVSEPVRITRMVPTIRMQSVEERDPATGKTIKVQKPVCEHKQVTETHTRITLCPREVEETVTNYRLERRMELRTKEEYVLVCEAVPETVTTYHLETQHAPRARLLSAARGG